MKTAITLPGKLGLLCSILLALSFIQKSDDPLDKLTTALQQWVDHNPQEKIYLHTDKPYYIIGDTLWFKAYVTTGAKHQLSAISGAVYIDLINEADSVAKQLKLPITSGMATGDIVLSNDLLREGNYRIRAYTQWMRNAGPEYFYDRTFTIGNAITNTIFAKIDYIYAQADGRTNIKALLKFTDEKGQPFVNKQVDYALKKTYNVITTGGGRTNALGEVSIKLPTFKPGDTDNGYLVTRFRLSDGDIITKTFPLKIASSKTDVQFFPESGNLVNGVKSKVAFKATGPNGLGVTVSGTVVDNTGKLIAQLEPKHLGMGCFFIMPEQGKTYQANITYPDGSTNTIKLPEAADAGYVLSAYNTLKNDSILVRINAGPVSLKNGGRNVNLIGQSGGKVYFALKIPVNNAMTALYLPVHDIPSGILQFTLFSDNGDPLNERIVFIQNKDNIDLQVSGNKQVYNRREKVDLNVIANDGAGKPVGGNFSVSVISETAVPSDEANENSIFSQLLLSSDIKGYIEKPNYYFYNPDDETRDNLDILMLTQGYRRFTWKKITAGNTPDPAFKAEKLINSISGRLTTLGHKPVPKGKVVIINNKVNFLKDTITDNDGRFRFDNLLITNGIDFSIQGTTAKNGKRVVTEVDQVTEPDITPNTNIGDINADIPNLVKESFENEIKQEINLQKHGVQTKNQLKEVEINAAKQPHFGGGIAESEADQVFRPDSRAPCKTLMECLMNMYKTHVHFSQKIAQCGPVWVPDGLFVIMIDKMLILDPCDYQSILLNNLDDINKIYIVDQSAAIEAKLLGGANMMLIKFKPLPVIAIYTKSGVFRKTDDASIVHYAPKGYDFTKEFYTPKYDDPQNNPVTPDLRSTIYWNPAVLTKTNGQTTVSYYNSDQTGTYRVTIEGIDANGSLARKVYRYKVE